MITEESFPQDMNGLLPMKVTESGIVMDVRLSHPENAQSPMEVTESGMVMDVRFSHL